MLFITILSCAIRAPGAPIVGAFNGSDSDVKTLTGVSGAAPITSGVAARFLEVRLFPSDHFLITCVVSFLLVDVFRSIQPPQSNK